MRMTLLAVLLCLSPCSGGAAEVTLPGPFAPLEINGFLEARAGRRTQSDPHARDVAVAETRLQAELFTYTDWLEFKFKGDVWADGVTERGDGQVREAWLFSRPTSFMDLKVGRQVLTWGTGDLVFVNDLFPKDWQSYFIGRDDEYLKAPSDAAKLSLFSELANVDLVYTPRFDADHFITGDYVSYWDASTGRHAGQADPLVFEQPDEWFDDDEVALRIYRSIGSSELALYGYRGFWKRPGGMNPQGAAIFPRLRTYGASLRGPVGPGIGNVEAAWYDSVDDRDGDDPAINNSQVRYLVGYAQELARDLTASVQFYAEQMLEYSAYEAALAHGAAKDELRQVVTLQLIQLLMNQNLELCLCGYYSPSDEDAYLRPKVKYAFTDNLTAEVGANVFVGDKPYTFFGQFENNTNMYGAVRYSF